MNPMTDTRAGLPENGHPLACPDCGAPMELRKAVVGKNPWYGCTRWRATGCKGAHGAHPDGRPMGTPANAETRQARIAAHAAFDTLWGRGKMKRREAYEWMQEAMGFSADAAHISKFDAAQCRQLVTLIEARTAAHV